jgi:hypothetical protein
MKQLISFLFVALLLILGCEQVTEVNDPVKAPQERILNKQLITLPTSNGLAVESQTYYQAIDGYYGGEFQKSYTYQTNSGQVYQYADLDFLPGAFSGTKTISMTFNSDGAAMELGPSMVFQADVEYTYKIVGVDLTGVNPNTLDFVYIDAIGNMYAVEYDYVTMDVNSGMLKVVNAILPHFSRYGFVN